MHAITDLVGARTPAILGPRHDNGIGLCRDRTRQWVKWLRSQSTRTGYVGGSSSAPLSVTPEDRMSHLEAIVDVANDEMTLVVHAAACDVESAVRIAVHAAQAEEVAAIAALPPDGATNLRQVSDYWNRIADATDRYFIAYCFDTISGQIVTPEMASLFAGVHNIRGLKYSGVNFPMLRELLKELPDNFIVLTGEDPLYLESLRTFQGKQLGAIGTSYQIFPGAFWSIHEAWRLGYHDNAVEVQRRCNTVIQTCIDASRAADSAFAIGWFQTMAEYVTGITLGPLNAPPYACPSSEAEFTLFRSALETAGIKDLMLMNHS